MQFWFFHYIGLPFKIAVGSNDFDLRKKQSRETDFLRNLSKEMNQIGQQKTSSQRLIQNPGKYLRWSAFLILNMPHVFKIFYLKLKQIYFKELFMQTVLIRFYCYEFYSKLEFCFLVLKICIIFSQLKFLYFIWIKL